MSRFGLRLLRSVETASTVCAKKISEAPVNSVPFGKGVSFRGARGAANRQEEPSTICDNHRY
jgi:hypothetical protein